ncbi:MAG: sensor histidine kinase [Actinomycetales bacterium]
MTRRATLATYGLLGALAVVGTVGMWLSDSDVETRALLIFVVDGLALAVAGAVLAQRSPAHSSGYALLAAGFLLLAGAALDTFGVGGADQIGVAGFVIPLPVAVLAFPARDIRTATFRAAAAVCLASGIALLATFHQPNAVASFAAVLGVVVACDVWWRTERSTGDLRRSLLWLAYGGGVTAVVGGHVIFLVDGGEGRTIDTLALVAALVISLVVPVTITVGAVNPRLRDIRALISQTVLYIVMAELALAVYIGGLSAARYYGREMTPQASGLLVIAIALGFHPVSKIVRQLLDELLFGGSADPVATMSAFGARLQADTDPQAWAESLRSALSLPRVEIWQGGVALAIIGEPVELSARTPLLVGDEEVGALVVGLPGDAITLPAATRGVINLVAAPLARAMQAVQLADQLQESRGQVVAALEEERRRIRRDLHDGLGPVLAGVGYSADAAYNLVPTDPVAAQALLVALRADAASAIADIRRIVVGLRPPALDELGLLGAVRQQTARLYGEGGRALAVRVTEAEPLPTLPAAVEVAAYRIAVEAVTNASRHSQANAVHADFHLREGSLVVTVEDDGGRINGSVTTHRWRPGVGLSSMRERCEQLGGSLDAGPTDTGGRVRATLPV